MGDFTHTKEDFPSGGTSSSGVDLSQSSLEDG